MSVVGDGPFSLDTARQGDHGGLASIDGCGPFPILRSDRVTGGGDFGLPMMEGPKLEHMPGLIMVFDWRGAWLWLVVPLFVERAADVPGTSLQLALL